MAELDKLLAKMIQIGAERAVLQSDQPLYIEVQQEKKQGPLLPMAHLFQIIREITPVDQRHKLALQGQLQFHYQSPQGVFHVLVIRDKDGLNVTLRPGARFHQSLDLEFDTYSDLQGIASMDGGTLQGQTVLLQPERNDSGMGSASTLPIELYGFNGGACFLALPWAIAHSVWWLVGVICGAVVLGMFVPFLGLFAVAIPFIAGVLGNEAAWKNREWDSIEEFKQVQKIWTWWGIGAFGFFSIVSLLIAVSNS